MLVAEDDPSLGEALAGILRSSGYIVDVVADGESALAHTNCFDYSVAVLEGRIPRLPGIDVVRRLRLRGYQVPVLMLGGRDVPQDLVAGLDAGADDYLLKPFDPGELLARLRALQRRPADMLPPVLAVGDLQCDPASHKVWFGDRRPDLTATELRILEVLMRRSPGLADRRQIAHQAWQDEACPLASNTIDVHVARVRRKLCGARVRIEPVRGIGYRIVPG